MSSKKLPVILIVQDYKGHLILFEKIIELIDTCVVYSINSPKLVMKNLFKFKPDIIIIDHEMPIFSERFMIETINKFDCSVILTLDIFSKNYSTSLIKRYNNPDVIWKPLDIDYVHSIISKNL